MITLVKNGEPNVVGTLNGQQSQYALLGFTNTGTGNYSTNSYGATGWQVAQFVVPSDGTYTLGFTSFNLGDTALSPILFIDEVQGTTALNGQTFNPVQPNSGSTAPPPPPSGPSLCCGGSASSFNANAGFSNRVTNFSTGSLGSVIIIEQIGSSNNTTVTQSGTDKNYIKYNISGNNNTMVASQTSTTGSATNYVEFAVSGSNNTTNITQQGNGGAKGVLATVANGNNNVTIQQKNNGNHYLELNLAGGNKTVNATQEGSAAHMANINLSGGATSITTTQSGATQQFYSITHNCATPSCAAITVTQGQ